MTDHTSSIINNEYYYAPEDGTMEDYIKEALNYPNHIGEIVYHAIYYAGLPIKETIKVFEKYGFDINNKCFYKNSDTPVMTIAAYIICDLDYDNSLNYILSKKPTYLGFDNIWDLLLDGEGRAKTWWGQNNREMQRRSHKIVKCINIIRSAGYGKELDSCIPSKWWVNDFLNDAKKDWNSYNPYFTTPEIRVAFLSYI